METVLEENKLSYKDKLCWILPVCGAIVIGLLYYFMLPIHYFGVNPNPTITLYPFIIVAFFVLLIYSLLSELSSKITTLFWYRGAFIIPLGSLVFYVLNLFSQRVPFQNSLNAFQPYGITYVIALTITLLVISFFSIGLGTLTTKLVRGFDCFANKPESITFSTNLAYEEVKEILKKFLISLGVFYHETNKKDKKLFSFHAGLNKTYVIIYKERNIRISFISIGLKMDTLIKADKTDFEVLIEYFKTYFNYRNREKATLTLVSDLKSIKQLETEFWKKLTSPYQLSEWFASKGLQAKNIREYINANKTKIFGYVISVILGGLIINWLTKIIGL